MRRVQLLINDIRRSVESQLAVGGGGISDEEILAHLNSAQYQLYCSIVQKNPDLLLVDAYIDIVANQEAYPIPLDAHLGSSLRSVWYLYGQAPTDYIRLPQQDTGARRSDLVADPAYYYERSGANIQLTPTPSINITKGLRITYQKQLRRLDLRRGIISGAAYTSTTLNTLTLNLTPTLGKDNNIVSSGANVLGVVDQICVIDKNGVSILNNIPIDSYDSTTGIVTVSAGFTTILTGANLIGNYVVAGLNSTDHCDFPDETVERYLYTYARSELLRRQGNPDEVANAVRELQMIESNLIDSYESPDQEIKLTVNDCAWEGWSTGRSANGFFGNISGGGGVSGVGAPTIANVGTTGQGFYQGLINNVNCFFNVNGVSPVVAALNTNTNSVDISVNYSLLSVLTSINSSDLLPFYSVSSAGNKGITFANLQASMNLTNLAGTLTVSHGGTGQTTLAINGVLVGNGTSAITSLAVGTTGTVLTGATGSNPIFSAIGTNSGLTAHGLLLGEGNSAFNAMSAGTTGQIPTSQGSSADPIWTTNTWPATNAQGDLLYGSALNTWTSLAKSATVSQYLANTGANNAPNWDYVNLSNGVTSTLGVGNGGTGRATLTNHGILVGATTSAITSLGVGTTGQVLIGSTGADPAFGNVGTNSGLTAHGILLGEGNSAFSAMSAGNAGQIPVSGGASADPGYVTPTAGTGLGVTTNSTTLQYGLTIPVVVSSGGTGQITMAAHGLLVGEGTSAVTSLATGSTGQILTSAGASTDPGWTTNTWPATNAQGDLLYGSATNVVSALAKSTTATRYLANTGTTNNPAWDQINLTNGVTGALPIANGGTNATSMATTDGVVIYDGTRLVTTSAGTTGQVLTSNGAGVAPTYQTSTASKFILVSQQAASNSATIDFTGLTGYPAYFVVITGCGPVTNTAILEMLISTNNGSTYSASGYANGLNTNPYNSTTITNTNSTTYVPISSAMANSNTLAAEFFLLNVNTGSGTIPLGHCSFLTSGSVTVTGTYCGQTPTGTNAIRFLFSSGNISSGTFTLYGVTT